MTEAEVRSTRSRTPSEQQWLSTRDYLKEHRHELSSRAAAEYPDLARAFGTPLLTSDNWIPQAPVPLQDLDLQLEADAPFDGVRGNESESEAVRPVRDDGTRYRSYSEAVGELAAPAVFQNRSTYRLTEADLRSDQPHMTFGLGHYFDGLDTGEASAHEYAAREIDGTSSLDLRALIGSPVDPRRRPMNVALSSLTLRHDGRTGDVRFPVHWRDPRKVGHAGGLYQVLPVGIFQPSSEDPSRQQVDFSLWRSLTREYAEELLGHDELEDVDYDAWPFAAALAEGVGSGSIRPFCLGMGVDPLTFATDLLTVVVFDSALFDDLFGDLVDINSEGSVIGATDGHGGVPFTESEVDRLVNREPMQAAGAAVLAAAWTHREHLLSA